ncbi:MAG: alkaline phosphatase [Oligoflexales bacterium]|nr:alkaline phosphatase [Oligoflexales bacterium]
MLAPKLSAGDKVIGLFSDDHLDYDLDRQKSKLDQPSLTEMVQFAIEHLSKNPKGYF